MDMLNCACKAAITIELENVILCIQKIYCLHDKNRKFYTVTVKSYVGSICNRPYKHEGEQHQLYSAM